VTRLHRTARDTGLLAGACLLAGCAAALAQEDTVIAAGTWSTLGAVGGALVLAASAIGAWRRLTAPLRAIETHHRILLGSDEEGTIGLVRRAQEVEDRLRALPDELREVRVVVAGLVAQRDQDAEERHRRQEQADVRDREIQELLEAVRRELSRQREADGGQ